MKKSLSTLLMIGALLMPLASQGSLAYAATGASVSSQSLGINLFDWDNSFTSATGLSSLAQLGGYTQFPTDPAFSWKTGVAMSSTPTKAQATFSQWLSALKTTGMQGIYTWSYGENATRGSTYGGNAKSALAFAKYIKAHHLPIPAIVVGSEVYGNWRYAYNQHVSLSAYRYAENLKAIADAIHSVLPNEMVGGDFDLNPTSDAAALWDQEVLRVAGGSIDFISAHAYPFAIGSSLSTLVSQGPITVAEQMYFLKQELQNNATPAEQNHLQIWITEMNLENGPDSLSLTNGYAGAMTEAESLFLQDGASKVLPWGFNGGGTNNGTFAFTGNNAMVANGTTVPTGAFLPTGQAMADFVAQVKNGVTQEDFAGTNSFVISLSNGQSFFVNGSASPQTFSYQAASGSGSVTIPAASYQTESFAPTSVTDGSGNTLSVVPYAPFSPASSMPALPRITSMPKNLALGNTYTIYGENFGATQGSLRLVQGGNVNAGGKAVTGSTTSWGYGNDSYAVPIVSWSNNKIVFQVPDNQANPPAGKSYTPPTVAPSETFDNILVQVATANQLDTPFYAASVRPSETASSIVTNPISQGVYRGEVVTLTGSGFGSSPGHGGLTITEENHYDGKQTWGYNSGNKIAILSWSDTMIQFEIPDGLTVTTPMGTFATGRQLDLSYSPGYLNSELYVQVTNNAGTTSNRVYLRVVAHDQGHISVPTTSLQGGQSVTITAQPGTSFGTQTGNVIIDQHGTQYGAPWNGYALTISSWTPTSITFTMNGIFTDGLSADLYVRLPNGQETYPIWIN